MNVLFDHNTPRPLRKYLPDHRVVLTKEMNWQGLANGKLLAEAQELFEVIITTDTNIEHQNKVADFDLAMIVLRGYSNGSRELAALMPQVNEALTTCSRDRSFTFTLMKNCGRLTSAKANQNNDQMAQKRKSTDNQGVSV